MNEESTYRLLLVVVVFDAQGLSYDAWGRRRDPATWEYYPELADAAPRHDRGFTGHEHIDLFDMVNMDGRIYDPVLGRFLSPDPLMQLPDFAMGLNRYLYCLDNPLSLTDPSGYSWFSRNWKSLLGAAVGIAAAVFTGGTSLGITNAAVAAMASGAIGGASGALVGSILNGSNLWQTVKSTITGGLIGGALGVLNYAAGAGGLGERLFKHVIIDATMSGLQGGNIFHGAMTGVVNCLGGYAISRYGRSIGEPGELAIMAIAGGTVAEIGGGKFANGALTASFSYLFNDVAHRWTMLNYKKLEKIWIYYYAGKVRYQNPNDFFKYVGGPLADWAAADPDNFQHPCAARLSDALNRAGFKIPEIHGVTYLGGEGNYYFINAAKMSRFLNEQWGQYKCLPKGKAAYGVIFQTGFSGGVSGHLDVLIYKFAAGKRYNTETYYWGIK